MKKTNVLMIDDNVELVNMVKEYFSDNEDVSITLTAHDGVEGLKLILERENEYDVIYKVSPSITNNFSNNKVTGINLKITDTLPKGIKYISGSCNYEEPEITNNEDETTVLTWYKYNCSIGEDIEPITYKAHISEETDNGPQFETKTDVQEVIA